MTRVREHARPRPDRRARVGAALDRMPATYIHIQRPRTHGYMYTPRHPHRRAYALAVPRTYRARRVGPKKLSTASFSAPVSGAISLSTTACSNGRAIAERGVVSRTPDLLSRADNAPVMASMACLQILEALETCPAAGSLMTEVSGSYVPVAPKMCHSQMSENGDVPIHLTPSASP